jgi:VanZ family protein
MSPAILWAIFIAILCGMPGKDIPHISFLELLSFDKWVHAGVFFVLQHFTVKGFSNQFSSLYLKKHSIITSSIICIVYGGALEIAQEKLFSNRTADVYDFIANTFGSCLYVILITVKDKIKQGN